MVKRITFKIDRDGEVSLEVDGASGGSCEELTKDFEAVLGNVDKREYKDAYYERSEETESQRSDLG